MAHTIILETGVSVAIAVPLIDMPDGKVGGSISPPGMGHCMESRNSDACRPDITRRPCVSSILTLD
jgi:hypothetical protein